MVDGRLSPTYQHQGGLYVLHMVYTSSLYVKASYEGRLEDDVKVVERVEDLVDEGDEVMVSHERLLLVHLSCHDVPGDHRQPLLKAVIPDSHTDKDLQFAILADRFSSPVNLGEEGGELPEHCPVSLTEGAPCRLAC